MRDAALVDHNLSTSEDFPKSLTGNTEVVILDTSVLMADAGAHLSFVAADVVIPLTVIDELDNNKSRPDEAGRNARTVLRSLEDLRLDRGGDISTATRLSHGGTLRIELNGLRLDELRTFHLDAGVADHRIIAAGLGVKHTAPVGVNVTVVSNDAGLRLKASVLGLRAAEHTPGNIGLHSPTRTGLCKVPATAHLVEALKGRTGADLNDINDVQAGTFGDVFENEFVLADGTALMGRRVGRRLVPLNRSASAWGAHARNKEQRCALDLLLDPEVQLVALRGHAGTGKSMLAIAAGLEQVIESGRYDQLMIVRPLIAVGRQDLGFLPGDLDDKLAPWFAAVVDSMVALSSVPTTFKKCQDQLAAWVDAGQVALEPVTFLRGRSLARTFMILDEAQNLEPSTVKTVISRLGAGSKLVMTGDTDQIDHGFLSEITNGLSVAVDSFAGVPEFGHVFLPKGERSAMADLAAARM